MATRRRETGIGVNLYLSNEELKSLDFFLKKLEDVEAGKFFTVKPWERIIMRRWGVFFFSALHQSRGTSTDKILDE
jgi:hypothetical protein